MRRMITAFRIIHAGIINFVRSISVAVAAIAVMVITLTIILFSVLTNISFSNTISQITAQIDISVYLKDSVNKSQTNTLVTNLKKLSDVKSVLYLDKNQVLAQYEAQNSNNSQLLSAISQTTNPLPATIIIKPYDLNTISSIKNYLIRPSISALQSDPPSYSGDRELAINRITHATNILRKIGVVAIIVFLVVSALIIFNTIQMTIFNRRDEIQTMRLLGASKTYIRGPFIVESIIYGIVAAAVSILLINELFVAATSAFQANSLGILNIGYANTYFDNHFFLFLSMQLIIGVIIGSVSSFIATRRYLKMKIK